MKLKDRLQPILVLLSCMVGGAAMSAFFLIHQSLRLDESQSLWQASHSLGGVLERVALDVHVPLYHLILHFWILYFGDSIVTARLLSLFFFLITIPVVYLLARQLLSRNWSYLTVTLFSFSPFIDWYASEARMYTLLVFFATLNQYFFLRIQKTGKGWIWYALTAMVGVYSHYFFMFNLLSQAIFYLWQRQSFKPGAFKRFVVVAILAAASLAPWLYYVYSLGSASGTRPQLPTPSTVDFFNVYSQFLFGFQNNRINTILLSSWPVVMLIALVAVARNQRIPTAWSFVMTMAFLPVTLAYVISLTITPFFLSRYMIACAPALFIGTVWLFSRYRQKLGYVMGVILALITVAASFQQITSASTPVKENYKQAVGDINRQVQPQDLVVLSAPFTIYPVEYYYRGSAQIETLPAWQRTNANPIPPFERGKMEAQIKAQNANHRYIFLLLSQDQGYEDTVAQYYLTHFKQVSRKTYSEGLTLYVYQVGYYKVPALTTN